MTGDELHAARIDAEFSLHLDEYKRTSRLFSPLTTFAAGYWAGIECRPLSEIEAQAARLAVIDKRNANANHRPD